MSDRRSEPADQPYRVTAPGDLTAPERVRRFRLRVLEGVGAGQLVEPTADRCAIGAHPSNDLVLGDSTASRFHCEVRITSDGPLVVDLGSRNGTTVDGVRVREAFLRDGSVVRAGATAIGFELGRDSNRIVLSPHDRFGGLVGRSVPMRALFALLERVAATDTTVLLEGESGTGKGAAAEALHRSGRRKPAPFIVVDCSAIPGPLLESELFGHEKGAFTGADTRRTGAFEAGNGGTIFLDEIGELPLDVQPKLLRVLENRTVRRVGANQHLPVDVRVVAATNRDLRGEVNAGRFRADLYYRLAVVRLEMPPLRRRPEDLAELARVVLAGLGAEPEVIDRLCTTELVDRLRAAAWPGNVRELRNYLERCLVFDEPGALEPAPAAADLLVVDPSLPFVEARRRILAEFERRYVEGLLRRHDGKVVAAARAAGINRVYLYRIARRAGRGDPDHG